MLCIKFHSIARRAPSLICLRQQGPLADEFLVLTKALLFSDAQYVARLERHYAAFKAALAKSPSAAARTEEAFRPPGDVYAPCPCGSGKRYKWCCRPSRSRVSPMTQGAVWL